MHLQKNSTSSVSTPHSCWQITNHREIIPLPSRQNWQFYRCSSSHTTTHHNLTHQHTKTTHNMCVPQPLHLLLLQPPYSQRTVCSRVPCCGLARCPPWPRPQRQACSGKLARTAQPSHPQGAGGCRAMPPSHATNQRRSWSVTAGVRPAVMWAYSAPPCNLIAMR